MKLPYVLEKWMQRKFSMLVVDMNFKLLDENGKVLKSHNQIGHSVTANFLSFYYAMGINYNTVDANFGFTAPWTNNSQVRNLAGVMQTRTPGQYPVFNGPVNIDTIGIVIGTGAPAVAPLTGQLTSKISHGSGVGQLLYQQQTSPEGIKVVGNSTTFRMIRNFINSSGATITVNELGIYFNSAGTSFMNFIDPISPSYDVNDGQSITTEITFETLT